MTQRAKPRGIEPLNIRVCNRLGFDYRDLFDCGSQRSISLV